MPSPPLATKLHFPQVRPNLVARPRLVGILEKGLRRPLTLISAPAGSGKTTLLGEWRAGAGSQAPVAWLSLDSADNDPLRFLAYLAASLEFASPNLTRSTLDLLQSSQPPPLDIVVSSLLDALNALTTDLILVLDDYHLITNLSIHETLNKLLEYSPPAFHLVILSRADPPLPLARLRVSSQLTEIRLADLRFTTDEVSAFLSQTMGLSLTQEQVASLEARTEGWIAGLQLAALSMQGRQDMDDFIAAFTGSHRFVADYLIEEVLSLQSEKTRQFLLKTSILERMSASLCNAVTGESEGQAMLEELERSNLFVVGLDGERQWYRYHHLFADILRRHLGMKPPEVARYLHRLASDWFRANGFKTEAFEHAVKSEDMAQVLRIVQENAWQMVLHGELNALLSWIEALPEELLSRHSWLRIYRAWALLICGETESAEFQVQLVEGYFKTGQAADLPVEMQGHMTAIRAWASYQKGDLERAVSLSYQAVELAPGMDPGVQCFLAAIFGQGCVAKNDFIEARHHYTDAVTLARASGNIMLEISVQCALGWLSELSGRLREAKQIYQNAAERAVQYKSPSLAQAYLSLANIDREWNGLESARRMVEKSIEYSRIWGHADALSAAYLYLARIDLAQNKFAAMRQNLDEMENVIRGHVLEHPTWIMLQAMRARLWMAQGEQGDVRRWATERNLDKDDPLDFFREVEYLTLARMYLAENRLDFAVHLLERLHQAAKASARWGNLIEILILQSEAFSRQGKQAAAFTALKTALELAEPEGYVRVFLDQGPPIESLLSQIKVEHAGLKKYINTLLASFKEVHSLSLTSAAYQPKIELLSERELEVLRLIASGASNKKVASELFIAIGTVKRHTVNIFNKLGVENRMEAVAKARLLEIL